MRKIHLLIIDPQNDFSSSDGSLFVPEADSDMQERLPEFIAKHQSKITDIDVTLDTHPRMHVAHGCFWQDEEGVHPEPFTLITREEVAAGKWKVVDASLEEKAAKFVTQNRSFVIWPEHCIEDTEGHHVVSELQDALTDWEETTGKKVSYVRKGMNPTTEQFSVFEAASPDPDDPKTHLNKELISRLAESDVILVAGEASSHCVADSVLDFANNVDEQTVQRIVLLKDVMSAVPGFEEQADEFFKKMVKVGARTGSTKQWSSY